MVSKSTGRSNSVQETRLATKTNQINFNEPWKFAVIFKQFSGKFLKPLRLPLANQTLNNE